MVVVIDVGARGGLHERWQKIKHEAHLFEPELVGYNKLVKTLPAGYKVYNIALSDKKESLKINVCKHPSLSSVYEYDIDYIKKYCDNWERYEIERQVTVKANTLDSFNINADFIKIDVEGYEYEVLLGAKDTLDDCIGIEVEVVFLPIWKGMPTVSFSNIYAFLVSRGFLLQDLNPFRKRDRIAGATTTSDSGYIFNEGGPLWAANPIWIKPPEAIPENKREQARIIYKLFKQDGYLRTLKG